jgi:hypothetical protein
MINMNDLLAVALREERGRIARKLESDLYLAVNAVVFPTYGNPMATFPAEVKTAMNELLNSLLGNIEDAATMVVQERLANLIGNRKDG